MTPKEKFLQLLRSQDEQNIQLALQLTEQNPDLVVEAKKLFHELIRAYPNEDEGIQDYRAAQTQVKIAFQIAEKFPELKAVIAQYDELGEFLHYPRKDFQGSHENFIVYFNRPWMHWADFASKYEIEERQNILLAWIQHLKYFPTVKRLNISNSQLDAFPKGLSALIHLEELALQENLLEDLAPEIGKLKNLKKLKLMDNQLKTLPMEIGELKNLNWLLLENNQLTSLPPEVGQLQKLEILDLKNNQLTELPLELKQLKSLKYISLKNNPIAESEGIQTIIKDFPNVKVTY